MRAVELDGERRARASIALRLYHRTRRVRAYLRWSDQGKTRERYVGEVEATTRASNLKRAWSMAHEVGMVSPEPPPKSSWASSRDSRAVMIANKSRDTGPELSLRSSLHRLGLRYRVSKRPIPELRRTADLVFTRRKVAIFVDGCFWHGCAEHHRPAKRNAEFWDKKIRENQSRDFETNRILRERGWTVVRIWEHQPTEEAVSKVLTALRKGNPGSTRDGPEAP